ELRATALVEPSQPPDGRAPARRVDRQQVGAGLELGAPITHEGFRARNSVSGRSYPNPPEPSQRSAESRMASTLLSNRHESNTKLRQPEFCVAARRWLPHEAGTRSLLLPLIRAGPPSSASRD